MKISRLPVLVIGASIAAAMVSPSVAFAGGSTASCSDGGLFIVTTTDQYIIDHPDTWDFEVTSMRLIPASGEPIPLAYNVDRTGPNGTEKYTTVSRVAPGQIVEVKFNLLDLVPFPDGTFYRGAFTTDRLSTSACPPLPPTTTTPPPTTAVPTTAAPTTLPPTTGVPTTVGGPTTVPAATTTPTAPTSTTRPSVTLVPSLPTLPAPTTVPSVTLPETGSDLQGGLVVAAIGLILTGAAMLSRSNKSIV